MKLYHISVNFSTASIMMCAPFRKRKRANGSLSLTEEGGITAGRFLSGVLTKKLSRWTIVYTSGLITLLSLALLMLPFDVTVSSVALFFVGMGVGPMFPNLPHLTPEIFGRDISGSIMGLQQTASYIGIMLMPWIFGLIAENLSTALFPFYLFALYSLFAVALLLLEKGRKKPHCI